MDSQEMNSLKWKENEEGNLRMFIKIRVQGFQNISKNSIYKKRINIKQTKNTGKQGRMDMNNNE